VLPLGLARVSTRLAAARRCETAFLEEPSLADGEREHRAAIAAFKMQVALGLVGVRLGLELMRHWVCL
jgi:hypothetical protein